VNEAGLCFLIVQKNKTWKNPHNNRKLLFLILKWGWIFLKRTPIPSGIQFTTHFIDLFVVKTNRFVGSSLNVILTRPALEQGCGKQTPGARK